MLSAQIVRATLIMSVTLMTACSKPPVEVGSTEYQKSPRYGICEANAKQGASGQSDALTTTTGITYSLRTPANYDPTRRHPLLIIFPPAGHNRFASEAFSKLTLPATQFGFIVAYPDHRPLNLERIRAFKTLPQEIAADWCIAGSEVSVTGHSDGGTVATALSVLPETRGMVKALAASAAGMTDQDLNNYACPKKTPALIMHDKEDKLFPGFGQAAARWWAACNQCSLEDLAPAQAGCVKYQQCATGAPTIFCEQSGGHRKWSTSREMIVEFLGKSLGS